MSSQINQRKGLKTIDIFERTKAKTYALPKSRKWTKKEPVPVPLYVNLNQVSDNADAPLVSERAGARANVSPRDQQK